jgi:ankyrin repeat protein
MPKSGKEGIANTKRPREISSSTSSTEPNPKRPKISNESQSATKNKETLLKEIKNNLASKEDFKPEAFNANLKALKEIKGFDINKLHYSNQSGASWSIVYAAAQNGQKEAIEVLIEAGADVNIGQEDKDGTKLSPLFIAALNGHKEAIKALIKAGANVNIGREDEDGTKDSPLFIAALNSQK